MRPNKGTTVLLRYVIQGFALAGLLALGAWSQADQLVLTYTTSAPPSGNFLPANAHVVWIQDSAGVFVKTVNRRAETQKRRLTQWTAANPNWATETDGKTGATANTFTTYNATWDLTNTSGAIVPNGTYQILMELTSSNAGPWNRAAYIFNKNGVASVQNPANQNGWLNVKIDYQVTGGPVVTAPALTASAASNIAQTSARLNGTLTSDGGAAATVTAYYGPADGGTTPASWASSVNLGVKAAGAFFADISGLTANTNYFYRFAATNSSGTGWAPGSISFATLAVPPPTPTAPQIANDPASGVTQTAATLNGHLVTDGGAAATVTAYWGPTDGGTTPASWAHAVNLGVSAGGALSAPLSGLTANTTYFYRFAATNSVGAGWAPATGLFSTPVTPPPPPTGGAPQIANDPASNITQTAATLNGHLVTDGGAAATVVLFYGTTDGGTIPTAWAKAVSLGVKPVGALTTDLTGLTVNTTYYFRFFAVNSTNAGWAPGSGRFATLPAGGLVVLPQVANDPAGNIAQTSARLNGHLVSDGGDAVTVTAYWGVTNGGTTPANWDGAVNLGTKTVGAFFADLSTLVANTNYYFRFSATNSAGTAWAPSSGIFATLPLPAVAPEVANDPAGNIAATAARLNGHLISDGGSPATIIVFYGPADGGGLPSSWAKSANLGVKSAGAFFADVTDLTADTTYYYRFYAANSATAAWASPSISFKTLAPPSVLPQIANDPASNIAQTTARLNGHLVSDGGAAATVSVYWGPADGGTTPASWAHAVNLGVKAVGAFYADITGLTANTTYYFRFLATNSAGPAWAAASGSFATPAAPKPLVRIAVSVTQLAFSNTNVGATQNLNFTISNPGANPLRVNSLVITGLDSAVYSITPAITTPLTLAAGGSKAVTVRFAPAAPQEYNHAFAAIGNDSTSNSVVSVLLRGTGILPGARTPSGIGSLGGPTRALALTNSAVFAGQGATLTILRPASTSSESDDDEEDRPRSSTGLTVLGRVRLPDEISGIAVSGSTVYVAAGPAGIVRVGISSLATPVIQQIISTPAHTYEVAVAGTLLASADGLGGARFFRIGTGGALTAAGSYPTVGSARAVALSGSTAYVLDEAQGLLILNVSNPAQPVRTGLCNQVELGQALTIIGSTAYIADQVGDFFIVSLANAAAPVVQGRLHLADMGRSIAVRSSRAYIATGFAGLQVVNVASASAPSLLGAYNPAGFVTDVALNTGTPVITYVADALGGVRAVNLATPASPVIVKVFGQQDAPLFVAASGTKLGLVGGDITLQTMSLSGSLPATLGSLALPGDARGIAVIGSTAYVADGAAGLKILNITNTASPVLLSTFATAGAAIGVAAAGSYALVMDQNTIYGVNISNPAAPTSLGAWKSSDRVYGVAVSGRYGFVADTAGVLRIFDLSRNPLVQVGSLTVRGPILGVAASGNIAALACARSGIAVVNVATPSAPVLASTLALPGVANQVVISNSVAYVADVLGSVSVVDVSAPTAPHLLSVFSTPSRAWAVAVNSTRLFVADDLGGLVWCNAFTPTATSPTEEEAETDRIHVADALPVTAEPAAAVIQPAEGAEAAAGAAAVGAAGAEAGAIQPNSGGTIIGGPARAVAMTESAVYAGMGGALTILQPFDPKLDRQVVLGQVQLPGEIEHIAIAGATVFVAAGKAGVVQVKVSDPAAPAIQQTIPSADHTYDVAVSGGLLGTADGLGGARFFKVSGNGALTAGGVYRTVGAARAVAISGSTAYVLDEAQGLLTLDISNPSKPKRSGTCNQVQLGQALAVAGRTAYVADQVGNFIIVDVSNPGKPVALGRTRLADMGRSIAIQSSEAYVAVGFTGVQVVSIASPSAPVAVGAYNPLGYVINLTLSARTPGIAYLADTMGGVRGVDLINLEHPPVLGVFKGQ